MQFFRAPTGKGLLLAVYWALFFCTVLFPFFLDGFFLFRGFFGDLSDFLTSLTNGYFFPVIEKINLWSLLPTCLLTLSLWDIIPFRKSVATVLLVAVASSLLIPRVT